MRLPQTLDRRQTLMRAALVAISGISLPPPLPAHAAYTTVPTGTIAAKASRLAEVEKLFALTPDDPYVFGEKAQLEYDIGALGRNKAFAAEVATGQQAFFRGLRIGVPNIADAVNFWVNGAGALVLDTRIVDGKNVTTVGFGPQSPLAEDGAKFALEMVEDATASIGENHQLQYIQLAIPIFRLSKIQAAGGELLSAYGWSEVASPGGLHLRVRIDETRRDPFELIALRTSSLKGAVAHYGEKLGMHKQGETSNRRKFRLNSINQNSLYESGDAFEPDRETGAMQYGYGDAALTTSVLLLPPKPGSVLKPASVEPTLLVVSAAESAATSPVGIDGVQCAFLPHADFK